MSDTSPEMQRLVAERYAAMTGAERLHIAAGMFDTVRAVILTSCPAEADAETRRAHLRRRLYPELDLPPEAA
jgi:hypothetical protein